MPVTNDVENHVTYPTNGSINEFDTETIESAMFTVLEAAGEDVSRPGLVKTPRRVARMYKEMLSGYHIDPYTVIEGALFPVKCSEMVYVHDMLFHSLCEHHMLPFSGAAHVAYLPGDAVVGLSKIPRVVDVFARRLQVQENLTNQIALFLQKSLGARGVAVIIEASHMCARMRGVRSSDIKMTTTSMLGELKKTLNSVKSSGTMFIGGRETYIDAMQFGCFHGNSYPLLLCAVNTVPCP